MSRVDVEVRHHLPQELLLIGTVVNRVIRFQPDRRGMSPQHPCAKAMKGADPDAIPRQEPADALGHLAGRFVGESDRQDFAGMDAPFDQPRDSLRNDPRLPGPRPREHQQWSLEVFDRFGLALREILRKCHANSNSISASQSAVSRTRLR
jgi:hypothetical protein